MLRKILKATSLAITVSGLLLFLSFTNAYAVPSFARQTGMACSVCHMVFPELTPFGRLFKLEGYTLSNTAQVKETEGNEMHALLSKIPPLSAMIQASYTSIKKAQQGIQNGNISFPQQLSVFYAGKITSKIGAFAQITYDGESGVFSLDMADVRYADHATLRGKDLIYGLTLNNNPTMQDVWNSTPIWGFPYASSSVAPTPEAETQIFAGFDKVGGLGAYVFWNNLIYAELSGYRTAQSSATPLKGVAPYWRIAVEPNWGHHSLSVGTYGMVADIYPAPPGYVSGGPTDRYTDLALDSQYQYISGDNIFSAHTTWIHEKRNLNASYTLGNAENSLGKLRTFKVDGTYYYKRRYGASVGYFSTTGSSDSFLYASSRTYSPDSNGFIIELNYLPWENTKLSLQYTAYSKFDGAKTNYDGSGRNASDNNTLYVLAWLVF